MLQGTGTETRDTGRGWKIKIFGECATLVRKTVSPSVVGDVPYIGLEHIGENTLHLIGNGVAADVTSTKTQFQKGDILFGKLRPYFRKVIRASFDGICSTDIWVVRAKDGIEQGFLYYCMASQAFVDFANSGSEGTRMPRASWEYVSRYKITFPSLPEQRRIAHILGTLDDKIALNRRMNETLEEMARALFKAWFIDFEPVRAKIEGRWRRGESLPGMPAELYDLFPDRLVDSELGAVPEGWAVGVLDDMLELLSGGTPRTSVAEYWDGDIPWYTAKDAPNLSDVFAIETERTLTKVGVENSATKILPAGTTLITARGTVGRLACLGAPMAMNQTCYGIRGANGYPDYFTYYTVRMNISELQRRTHGTIFDTITRQTFKFVQTIQPPVYLAKTFESMVNSVMARILRNLQESRTLAAMRDTLLPKLISGEFCSRGATNKTKEIV